MVNLYRVFKFKLFQITNKCLSFATGKDIRNSKREDAGFILADVVQGFMHDLGIENGLKDLGFTSEDIPSLVEGTLPQVNYYLKLIACKNFYFFVFCT